MADRRGETFGRLTIVHQYGALCRAVCLCGGEIETSTYNVTSGRASSCGCIRKEKLVERQSTHGMSGSPTYVSWVAMKRRCNNPALHNAANYAGISYDPRWERFELFLKDMGERPEGTTLDRIRGKEGYSKENCRWATSREQWENRDDPRIAVHRENPRRGRA